MACKLLIAALLLLALLAVSDGAKCNMHQSYPPPANMTLQWYTVDLDQPPQERWTAVVQPRAQQIKAMVDEVLTYLVRNPKTQELVERILDGGSELILQKFPQELADEVRGIQKVTGVEVGLLVVMQIMYEVEGACTSILAQNADGSVYHARNLDFGLFDGWDNVTHTWSLTELLRPLLVNVHMVKGGRTLYNATYFAGFVGLLTGAKEGGFSITVNTRFDSRLDRYLLEWIAGKWQGTELSVLTRSVMETETNYQAALQRITTEHIVGPAYIILGGVQSLEGAIVTRNASGARDVWTLQEQQQAGKFFLVQTNYDHWLPDPFFDARRGPAEACLEQIGAQDVRPEKLFNVLSAQPNLNQLTTYTTLMHVASGRYEGYLQYCPHPCTPW